MITIAFVLSALVCLVLAWRIGRSCRGYADSFTPAPARLCRRWIRERRLCPTVEFELDGKTVNCSCLPVSGKAFPYQEGEQLTVYYRREKKLGIYQLTVAADVSSIRERRILLCAAAIVFCIAGIAFLAISAFIRF